MKNMVYDFKSLGESMFTSTAAAWAKIRQAEANVMFPHAIAVRYKMEEKLEMIHVTRKRGRGAVAYIYRKPALLYSSPLPLSRAKRNDLLRLCFKRIIPALFHEEYKAMTSSNIVRDCVDEPDEVVVRLCVLCSSGHM